jgi:hypothetical protein
LAQINPLES